MLKQLLEESSDRAILLTIPHSSLGSDGSLVRNSRSAYNNTPFLIFFDHFQIQFFTAIKQKWTCDHHFSLFVIILIERYLINCEILDLYVTIRMVSDEII